MNTKSLDLEASSSQYAFITDENQTNLGITGDCSFEAWIKLESLPSVAGKKMTICGKWADGVRQYIMQINTANKLELTFSDNGSDSSGHWTRFTSNSAIVSSTGVWYHIAGTFDISEETAVMYLNASSVANTKTAGSSIGASITNQNNPFRVGSSVDGAFGEYLDGLIDDVRVWNDIRTPEEIADNYQKELVGNEAGLVGYWKFNNNYLDETANNNDLTASGSPVFSTDVPFVGAYTLVVDTMTLAFTYADVTLKKAIKLIVDTMAMSFTFADVIFNNALTLIVDTMALSLTYADVTLKKAVKLVVNTMSLVLDFKNVILRKTGWTNDIKPTTSWTEDTKPSTNVEYLVTEALDYLMTEAGEYLITNQSNVWSNEIKPS